MTLEDLPAHISVGEVALLLRVTRRTALVAVLAGDIPTRRVGYRVVVPVDRLLTGFGVPSKAIPAAVHGKEKSA